MEQFKVNRVALLGASGIIGTAILQAVISKGFEVVAISRVTSNARFPPGCKVLQGDYEDVSFREASLRGVDALVLCFGTTQVDASYVWIDSAIGAGVKWIVPSEFGTDTGNEEYAKHVPIVPPKVSVQQYLNRRLAEHPDAFIWTGIIVGLIFEWSLERGVLGIDVQKKNVLLLDDGLTKFNASTLSHVGTSVANLFKLPSSEISLVTNKLVYVRSFLINQLDIWHSVRKATGTKEQDWAVSKKTTDDYMAEGQEYLEKGDFFQGAPRLIYGHVMKEGQGGNYESIHGLSNELLGLDEKNLDQVVLAVLSGLSY